MYTARDIMVKNFHTLRPTDAIPHAIAMFRQAGEEEGRRIFGMMVTDDDGRLIGMVSMYDILLFMRPKHVHVWGTMEDIDTTELLETICERARPVLVADIMTDDVVSVAPDAHIMLILDIMIKKHIRRIPVLDGDRIEGIVYISDLFHYLADCLASDA